MEIIGKKFNRLTVVEKTEEKASSGAYYYKCECECGNNTLLLRHQLIRGYTKSCGCFLKEKNKGKHPAKKIKKCLICGSDFVSFGHNHVYCSSVCNFADKINILENGCWEWQGSKNMEGYGIIRVKYKAHLAHRFSYQHHKGQIAENLCVCHTCDNPSCVNPDHLFLGTKDDNNKDKMKKGRHRPRTYTEEQKKHYSFINSGSKNKSSKLTEEQALYIKNSKEQTKELSLMFGVHKETIKSIRRGSSWKHL